jgi:TonB-dependent receptor
VDQAATGPGSDTSQPIEEVVVTGIRASLQKSLDVKQQSIGVVDAISAEDIGQFPDASIGQAIGRMPGVTVDRGTVNLQLGPGKAGGAGSSTGSVSGITVRGFGPAFNESLINGRPIASGLGQNFDFSALGSQWVSEVDVLKTPDFSLTSGDIGATINIKFPNPLDHKGFQARAYASGTDRDTDGAIRPGAGFLLSDTFADDTLGILVAGDYSDQRIQTHHLDIVGWVGTYLNCNQYATQPAGCAAPTAANPTPVSPVPSWSIQDMAMYLERAEELRKDGRLALQWHPTDAVLVTIDDNFSSFEQRINRLQFSTWFNNGSLTNVVTDGNGTVTDFTVGPLPTDFNSFIADTYIVTNTPGINVAWDVNQALKVEFDADQSWSQQNPNHTYTDIDVDVGYGPSDAKPPINGYIGGVHVGGSNTVPYWTAYGPGANVATNPTPGNFFGTNPFIIGSHVFPIQEELASDKINQARLETTWHTPSTKVKLGVQFVADTYNTSEYSTFDFEGSNGYWQLWSGYGPANHNSGGVALPPSFFTPINLSNFIPGFSGNGNLPPGLLAYNPYTVANYLITQPINAGFTPTNGYGPYVPGALPTLGIAPANVSHIERKNWAPYLTGSENYDFGDMKLKTNVAVRYEKTDVTIDGLAQQLLSLGTNPKDPTAYVFNLTPTALPTHAQNSYHYFLPSLDLNLLVSPELKVRLDASRTETAAPNLDITPSTAYQGRVNSLVGTGHNPYLLPYLSKNFDLGAEWYYASNSYLSADAFLKHVTQFPVQGVQYVTFPNVIDPAPNSRTYGKPVTFAITANVNGQAANVTGVELTWQQMLGLGFGYQVNGTYVHTNKGFDPNDHVPGVNQFALPGIGNSANFIGFYQNYGFQARVTLQWQAEQFIAFGQEQDQSKFGLEPTFLAASTQVDFSSSYEIDSHLSVFFEALNLNDAEYHTRGRFDNQLLNVVDYGRTFTIGVRAKL